MNDSLSVDWQFWCGNCNLFFRYLQPGETPESSICPRCDTEEGDEVDPVDDGPMPGLGKKWIRRLSPAGVSYPLEPTSEEHRETLTDLALLVCGMMRYWSISPPAAVSIGHMANVALINSIWNAKDPE